MWTLLRNPRRSCRSLALALCSAMLMACGGSDDAWEGGGFTVALVSLDGKPRVLGTLPFTVFAARVSPDGKQLAFEMGDTPPPQALGTQRVWVASLEKLRQRRALPAVGTGRNWAPMWTRDGERLIFVVSEADEDVLYWRRADGSGTAERLVDGLSAESTAPDGRQISFITAPGDRDYDISLLDLVTRATTVLVDLPRSEQHSSAISPDGQWIAYSSNETGVHDIWVEPLPPTGTRHRITRDGGSHPVWSRDGASLFFDRGGTLFRVGFEVGKEAEGRIGIKAGEPQALPISGFQQGYRRRQFDLMPDGAHFLMLYPPGVLR